jgi:hypothetical protein
MGIIAGSRLRASAFSPFIIEVDTSKAGSASNQFQFTGAEGDYDVIAKQNDIVVATFNDLSGAETITLPSVGIYVLEILPKGLNPFTGLRFNYIGDKSKLLKVLQWGSFSDLREDLFFGCSNLIEIANDCQHLNTITNGKQWFRNAGLNSLPETLTLENLESGFLMFLNCNLSELPSLMSLNNVVDGRDMFALNRINFLPSVMTLNSLEQAFSMFNGNNLNDLPIGIKLPNLKSAARFLLNNTINTARYSQLLVDMEDLNGNNNVNFHGGNSKYNTDGETARNLLTTNQSWSFSDGGLE